MKIPPRPPRIPETPRIPKIPERIASDILPKTDFLLKAYKEHIKERLDIEKLSPFDLDKGLEMKEKILSKFDHKFLSKYIENYNELEELIALDPKNHNLIKLLKCEEIKISELSPGPS